MDSILTSIKKLLGIEEDYTHFDSDLTLYINSALSFLTQMGVGLPAGLVIKDSTSKWKDFLGEGYNFEAVKTYVYLKVRLLFDPPTSSALIDSMKNMIAEHEFRLFVNSDPPPAVDPVSEEAEMGSTV
jgi:hypothetical protein